MPRAVTVRLGETFAEREPRAFGRPTEVKERVQLIVDAAARRFETQGFHGTSMQEIAEDVGITKAALYHYFSSKDRLLYMVHDAFVSAMLDAAEGFIAEHADPQEQLSFFVCNILETVERYRPYVKAFFRDYGALPDDLYGQIREKRDRYELLVERCLAEGISSGVFVAGMDPKLGALFLFGACNWTYQWFDPGGEMSATELAEVWNQFLINGLSGATRPKQRAKKG